MTAALEISSLAVRYGGVAAVQDIDLEVGQGEVVALLGANGAGKSSTLRAISGIAPVSEGTIRLGGADVTRRPPHQLVRAGLSHVPEGRGTLNGLTVHENLLLGGYRLASDLATQRAQEMMERFPILLDRRGQTAGLLSGGEQQILAIARGLMADPDVLTIDEPSLGLAPVWIKVIVEAIGEAHASGVSILLVEQNVPLALQVADRAYVMRQGEVVASGPAEKMKGPAGAVSYY